MSRSAVVHDPAGVTQGEPAGISDGGCSAGTR